AKFAVPGATISGGRQQVIWVRRLCHEEQASTALTSKDSHQLFWSNNRSKTQKERKTKTCKTSDDLRGSSSWRLPAGPSVVSKSLPLTMAEDPHHRAIAIGIRTAIATKTGIAGKSAIGTARKSVIGTAIVKSNVSAKKSGNTKRNSSTNAISVGRTSTLLTTTTTTTTTTTELS